VKAKLWLFRLKKRRSEKAVRPYDFVGFYRQLGRGEFSMPRKF
jgi:hypothetical protein